MPKKQTSKETIAALEALNKQLVDENQLHLQNIQELQETLFIVHHKLLNCDKKHKAAAKRKLHNLIEELQQVREIQQSCLREKEQIESKLMSVQSELSSMPKRSPSGKFRSRKEQSASPSAEDSLPITPATPSPIISPSPSPSPSIGTTSSSIAIASSPIVPSSNEEPAIMYDEPESKVFAPEPESKVFTPDPQSTPTPVTGGVNMMASLQKRIHRMFSKNPNATLPLPSFSK